MNTRPPDDVRHRRAQAQRLAGGAHRATTAPTTAARALVDKVGLGAPVSSLAIYPFTVTDNDPSAAHRRQPLRRPFLRVGICPSPVRAFWSLTLYDSHGFFVPNPAHVYLINNRSHVHYNADGSLDLYIQPSAPSSALAAPQLAALARRGARSG